MGPIDLMACETGVCGAIMYDSRCLPAIMAHVDSEDFQTDICRAIFDTAVSLRAKGQAVDPITIRQHLRSAGYTDGNETEILTNILDATPTAAHAEFYAKGLKKISTLRKANSLILGATAECDDPDDLISRVMGGLYELGQGREAGAVSSAKVVAELYEWARNPEIDQGIKTGHGKLDGITRGFHAGDLVLLGARPSVGKSAFGCNIALDAAKSGFPSVIFSCEMSRRQIVQRFLAREAWIDLSAVQSKGFLDDRNLTASGAMLSRLSTLPWSVVDRSCITTADIRRTLQAMSGVRLAVIDYLQLLRGTGKSERRDLEVAKISGELKQMAREFGIPIILLSQLNRDKSDMDEPSLRDFRDSGAVEQDADMAIFLWRMEEERDGLTKIGVKVAKNRMGRCGTVVMHFEGAQMRYTELAEEYIPKSAKERRPRKCDDDLPEQWRMS